MKTTEELRKLDHKGLLAELELSKQNLFKLTFNLSSGQSSNVADVRKYKKQVARIKTIIKEKFGNEKNEESLEKNV